MHELWEFHTFCYLVTPELVENLWYVWRISKSPQSVYLWMKKIVAWGLSASVFMCDYSCKVGLKFCFVLIVTNFQHSIFGFCKLCVWESELSPVFISHCFSNSGWSCNLKVHVLVLELGRIQRWKVICSIPRPTFFFFFSLCINAYIVGVLFFHVHYYSCISEY